MGIIDPHLDQPSNLWGYAVGICARMMTGSDRIVVGVHQGCHGVNRRVGHYAYFGDVSVAADVAARPKTDKTRQSLAPDNSDKRKRICKMMASSHRQDKFDCSGAPPYSFNGLHNYSNRLLR